MNTSTKVALVAGGVMIVIALLVQNSPLADVHSITRAAATAPPPPREFQLNDTVMRNAQKELRRQRRRRNQHGVERTSLPPGVRSESNTCDLLLLSPTTNTTTVPGTSTPNPGLPISCKRCLPHGPAARHAGPAATNELPLEWVYHFDLDEERFVSDGYYCPSCNRLYCCEPLLNDL